MYVENENNKLNQYSRRENIEILNVPPNIKQNQLEDCVINILEKMDIHITKFQIHACHRLPSATKSQPGNVIVRFISRKIAVDSLRRRKKLIGTGLLLGFKKDPFIVENLCPAFKAVYEEAVLLRNHREIFQVWSFSGIVHIRLTENSNPRKVFRIDDLYDIIDYNSY